MPFKATIVRSKKLVCECLMLRQERTQTFGEDFFPQCHNFEKKITFGGKCFKGAVNLRTENG